MSVEDFVILPFAIFVFVGWSFVWLIHIAGLIYGKIRLHRPDEPPSPEDIQGISILKPLVGVDPNLKNNLESFFKIKYPSFELLFCVQDENDPAILVVQSLIQTYPKVDAKLFIGIKYVGPNGKINNVARAYEACRFELVLISDSNILIKEDTLTDMISTLKSDIGIVIQMPYVKYRKGFPAVYEQVFFGTMQARSCLSCNGLGLNCTTGMSMMMRKCIIEDAGGLAAFGKYLAEDYFLAQAATARGYKTKLCSQPCYQNSGTYEIGLFHQRLLRWSRLRISMIPIFIVLEPLYECVLIGALASWAMEYMFDISSMGFFLTHILVWFLLDYTLIRLVENGPLPFSKFEFLVAWLLREFTTFYMFLSGHCTINSPIVWRNKKYKLRWGGVAEEL